MDQVTIMDWDKSATMDDLFNVRSVDGWFKGHKGIKNLTPLGYTAIDSLHTADIQPLTKLEQVALPATLAALVTIREQNWPSRLSVVIFVAMFFNLQ